MTSAIHERSKVIAQLGADSDSAQRTIHANYKEQVFLQRRIFELERSEKTTARSFSVEQRVTFRRFNRKLTQSKLLHARLTGNRDLETACRHRLFSSSCNTEMSRLEEAKDLDRMLTVYREERYPSPKSRCATRMTTRTAPSRMVRTPTPAAPTPTLRVNSAVIGRTRDSLDANNNRLPSPSTDDRRPRAKSACPNLLRIFIEANELGADPTRALQTDATDTAPPQPLIDVTAAPPESQDTTKPLEPLPESQDAAKTQEPHIQGDEAAKAEEPPTEGLDAVKPPEQPPARVPTPATNLLSPTPTQGLRPTSRASTRPSSRAAGHSWLDDKPRMSLREFNAVLMRVSNHDGRVRQFCESLKGLERQTGPDEDAEKVKQGEEESETKVEQREIGDVALRNMTFRNLQKPLFIYTHGVGNAKTRKTTLPPPSWREVK